MLKGCTVTAAFPVVLYKKNNMRGNIKVSALINYLFRDNHPVALLLIFNFAIRLLWIMLFPAHPESDYAWYYHTAHSIYSGGGEDMPFIINPQLTGQQDILFFLRG